MRFKRKKGNKGGEPNEKKKLIEEEERKELIENFEKKKNKMDTELKIQEGKTSDKLKKDLEARRKKKEDKLKKEAEINDKEDSVLKISDKLNKKLLVPSGLGLGLANKEFEKIKRTGKNTLKNLQGTSGRYANAFKEEIGNVKNEFSSNFKEKVGNLKENVKEKVGNLKEKVKENVGNLKEKVGILQENVKENVGNLKEKVKENVGNLKENVGKFQEKVKENVKEKVGNLQEFGKTKIEEGKSKFDDFKKSSSNIRNAIISESDDTDILKDVSTDNNLMDSISASVAAATFGDFSGDNKTGYMSSSKKSESYMKNDIASLAAATASAAIFGNSNNNSNKTSPSIILTNTLTETVNSNNLWGNIKYNKYPLLILIVLIINSYFIIANIIKYSYNNSLYNNSLTLKLNLYENKYNNFEFYNLPVILSLYIISFILLILYYRYNEKKGGVFDLDYNSNCVISMIYFALIIVNIVIISLYAYNWMYHEIYNKINESLKMIDDKIYSEISPKFLYFMHKLESFGDNINSAKDLINKFINDYKDLKKNTDNIEEIIKDRLKLLITYKINKYYINSNNKDSITNIESLINENKKNLFLYLKSDKYNILEPLEVEDIDIDEILKPFTSGANTVYNIEDIDGTIKNEIRKRYEEIQRSTNKSISYIKNNSGNIYSRIFIYLSIISIFCYFMLIISYIYILVYKIFNGKTISTKDLILYHYINYGYSIYIIIFLLGLIKYYIV